MSSTLQTVVALGIVAIAAALLARHYFKKRTQPGCGSDGCAAVSPEIRKLKSKLKE